jgi:hypothetical protein
MSEPLIPEGCILLSRKLLNSGIFNKPPLYIKVWIYLLTRAQHKDYKGLKRGQLWTSIPEIQKACSYYIGFRKEIPTKKQIFDVLEWLRNPYEADSKGTMITTTKGTHGILVNIEKYELYQDIKNYERNDESNNEEPTKGTTREQYKQECKRMNNIDIDHFDTFWKAYPRKTAKAAAKKSFDKLKVDEPLLEKMLAVLEVQKQSKQWQDTNYIPHGSTWLSQKRFEDEIEEKQNDTKMVSMGDGTFKLE